MSQSRSASYEHFLARYERLKADYFSPKSQRVEVDEEGEPIPSCHMDQSQIAKAFREELYVQVPQHRTDPPKFLDGTVGPGYVAPRTQAPPKSELVDSKQTPIKQDDQGRLVVSPVKAKPKMVHCSAHGKSLAVMMDDDVLMCETCYKNSLTEVQEDIPVPESLMEIESRPGFGSVEVEDESRPGFGGLINKD